MRLMVCGGDARMLGAVEAAKRAGWETALIDAEAGERAAWADAVILPWPRSFEDGRLAGTQTAKAQVLAALPPCGMLLHGKGVTAEELTGAQRTLNPAQDEGFLSTNARLTAEGAIARAMGRQGRALLDSTCVVTGFGRIGQALAARLAALQAFVIVCVRSEAQMRRAHDMGAHPLPMERLAQACAHADVIFNTVPARIFSEAVLAHIGRETLLIELASPPYGADPDMAHRMNVSLALESGLPGRYAPMEAGAALFEVIQRHMKEAGKEPGEDRREGGKGGHGDG